VGDLPGARLVQAFVEQLDECVEYRGAVALSAQTAAVDGGRHGHGLTLNY
jgi:hypothetical protein